MEHFKFLRSYDNNNTPILNTQNETLPNSYFNLIKLSKGQNHFYRLESYESVVVVMQGKVNIKVDEATYKNVGVRKDIWSGNADSVYSGIRSCVEITAVSNNVEIAIAGGICSTKYESFRITPEEVDMVDVGSNVTKSHRKIYHITGQNANGRAGNLLVSELYTDEGCWSGYPPHKHDIDNYPEETEFEEIYHYRFNPESGFGGQFCFRDESEHYAFMIRQGDTFAFKKGYHPTVTSPGHSGYIFTILVGIGNRSLIQNFKEEYRYLMEKIPGINDMRNKFK